jgi:uracil-DNA glycosylase
MKRRCERHLDAELKRCCVRVIVAQARSRMPPRLLARRRNTTSARPTFAHGAVVRLPNDLTIIGSYHPSRQNTNTGRLTQAMMRGVFRAARAALD